MKFTHCSIPYRSHDVTFAILVSQGSETAAILLFQSTVLRELDLFVMFKPFLVPRNLLAVDQFRRNKEYYIVWAGVPESE